MKKIIKIPKCKVLIIVFLMLSLFAEGQFITIEGRQFKKNGQDFYPMVCNYNFEYVYNDNSTNYYLSREHSYGPGSPLSWNSMPNYEFECTDSATAYNEILDDFTKIHDMGFNCIRTVGYTPNKNILNQYLKLFSISC